MTEHRMTINGEQHSSPDTFAVINPATGEPFARLRPLVLEFLERNVPAPSEIMIGVWDGALKYSSPSTREAILEDPEFVDAVLERG